MAELLERARAALEVELAVGAARDGCGGVVLVAGPAGSGRSAVLGWAADVAQAAGLAVRTWTAAAGEAARPYAAAHGLLGADAPALDEQPGRWHAAIAALVAGGPLALVVDDAEQADAPSLHLLAAIARRAAQQPLLLIAATGDGPLTSVPGAREITVGPLSATGSAALVQAIAPGVDADACHVAGAGLPRYVVALAEHGGAGCPPSLARRLADRLAALDPDARALAHALAILGEDVTWPRAGRLAAVADGDARRAAADTLRAAGFLCDTTEPRFTAPVVARAVAQAAPPGAAATLRRRAAGILAADGAGVERTAAHLLATEPDGEPWVWQTLAAAAEEAMERGLPETAVALLTRALAEPPAPADRSRLLVGLGVAETLAFRIDDAIAHLRVAVGQAGSAEDRLAASVALVSVLTQGGDPVRDLDAVLAALHDLEDRRLREQVEAHVVNQARQHTVMQRAARPLAQAIVARVTADADGASAGELAAAAAELTMAGERPRDAARLAAAALHQEPDPEPMRSTSVPTAIRCLAAADRLDEAARFVDAALADGRARNASLEVTMLHAFGADVAWRAGDLRAAERLARAAWDGGKRERWAMGHPATTATLVLALLDRGATDEAEAVLAAAGFGGLTQPGLDIYTAAMLLHARGRLRLAQGDATAAAADLRACGARLDAHAERNPALIAWRSPLALAVGGREGVALADEELALARRFGARRAIGIALRARALLLHDAERLALLREAVATLAASPARAEHARAQADLGEALLAAGDRDAARAVAHDAYELAHRCGAAGVAAHAGATLRVAGARPRRPFRRGPESLTARERHVCELARDGHTNRAIAALLVVTVSTVEYHLASAYRKLEIGSRRELAAALGSGAAAGGGADAVGRGLADRGAVEHPAAELDGLAGERAEPDAEAPVTQRPADAPVDEPLDPLPGGGHDHQLERGPRAAERARRPR